MLIPILRTNIGMFHQLSTSSINGLMKIQKSKIIEQMFFQSLRNTPMSLLRTKFCNFEYLNKPYYLIKMTSNVYNY